MAAKKKRTKRGKATVERKYEVRTEIANFTLAKYTKTKKIAMLTAR